MTMYLYCMLVGDWGVGQTALCERMNPGFAPLDGYHMHHHNNIVPFNPDASLEPLLLSSMGPKPKDWAPSEEQLVKLQLNILNPFDDDENVVRMTPLALLGKDVIGLCYNVAGFETLERVVHKWFPKICHYQPTVPVVLIGCPPNNNTTPIEPSSGENESAPSDKAAPQVVTTEQVRQAAAQIGAIHSLMWVEPGVEDTNDGASTSQAHYSSMDDFTKRVFRTLATVAYWHVRQQKKDVRNPGRGPGCIVC